MILMQQMWNVRRFSSARRLTMLYQFALQHWGRVLSSLLQLRRTSLLIFWTLPKLENAVYTKPEFRSLVVLPHEVQKPNSNFKIFFQISLRCFSLSISVSHCVASSLCTASRILVYFHLHPATRHQFTAALNLYAHHLPDVCVGVFTLRGSSFSRSLLSLSHT